MYTNNVVDVSSIPYSEDERCIAELLNDGVIFTESIGGGRNNKVYRVLCSDSRQYIAKFYFRHKSDKRDRLGVEFSSLQFLWKHGIRCIPQPIVADSDRGVALYEYIEGEKIPSNELEDRDVQYLIQFLKVLKELKKIKDSRNLPIASEACFSMQAIVMSIEQRLARLSTLQDIGEQYQRLRQFLENEFISSLSKIITWCKQKSKKYGISFVKAIRDDEKILSPSDFGFHNVLKLCCENHQRGPIIFLDFEYFGWDDPAKIISDFLFHPAMDLNKRLKQQFVRNSLKSFEDHKNLSKRLKVVYPLVGLQWCMRLLNEFVPTDLIRRSFISKNHLNKSELQIKQLSKARQVLYRVLDEYEDFPYL